MNKKHLFFWVILIALPFLSASLYGQDHRVITGTVKDSSTKKTVPYASVTLTGTAISNITNSEGAFTLKIPAGIQLSDSLVISNLGYASTIVAFRDYENEKYRTVFLQPSPFLIHPVLVRPNDAEALVNSAFSRIKENYPRDRQGLVAFYREIIKRGNRYITLNEAVLDILKTSYLSGNSDDIAIYKGRGNQHPKENDTLFLKLQGGAVSALDLDVMKYPFIGVTLMQMHDFYDFQMGPSTSIDGREVYTILFDQKKSCPEVLFRGKLYIDNESLAVVRITFSMNVEGREEAWKEFVKKKPADVNIGVDYANYQIDYKKYGSRWYYQYGRIDLGFRAKYKGRLLKSKYFVTCELAVTDTGNKAAFRNTQQQKVRFKDIMSAKVTDFTDDTFWGNYNVIEPDAAIENIIHRIIRQLKRNDPDK